MRVVQLLPELNEGGVERGVVDFNREFVQRGIDSIVISRGGHLAAQVETDGGRHICLDISTKNPLTVPSRVYRLRRLLSTIAPDIVHARSRLPAWLACLANRKLRLPFVTTVHGMNSISRYSRIMTRGDRVICVGPAVRDYIMQNYPVDADRVTVIERGVDMCVFDPANVDDAFIDAFRHDFNLAGRYLVTSVGRVTWLKDYESFIHAIARCREQVPEITGLIVGGVRSDRQDYMAGLQQLARDEGVEDNIIFTGSQSHMPEIYRLSDVVVNASLKMGNVGRTVTEALAMDTPVIATTFEGLDDLVEDGVNGFVIANRDPAQLADRIMQLYSNPVASTRETVRPEFTLDRMVEDTLAVYRSLLDERAEAGLTM